MIRFEKYKLANGLSVILHEDKNSPLVAVNVLYKVGSKNEDPNHTGFAHLFEHLMFTGSKHVPDFDIPIQMAGGENNAFTNSDITNYYNIIPAENLETALWLEADRMKDLNFDQEKLNIQKKVVIEEFYETCLNQPYGDIWHHVSRISYVNHPYRWPTIGLEPAHIEQINLQEAQAFYDKYYLPSNAIIVLAGNIDIENTKQLVSKYFEPIPSNAYEDHILPEESIRLKSKQEYVKSNVSMKALYMTMLMPGRNHPDYYAIDLISDILANGRSSRFFLNLYKKQKIFAQIDAYVSGTLDPGLFIIEGRLLKESTYQDAQKVILTELTKIMDEKIPEAELQKVKNKVLSNLHYSEVSVLGKAINLAYYESIGDASMINEQATKYEAVTVDDIQRCSKILFSEENCASLFYGN